MHAIHQDSNPINIQIVQVSIYIILVLWILCCAYIYIYIYPWISISHRDKYVIYLMRFIVTLLSFVISPKRFLMPVGGSLHLTHPESLSHDCMHKTQISMDTFMCKICTHSCFFFYTNRFLIITMIQFLSRAIQRTPKRMDEFYQYLMTEKWDNIRGYG